MTALSHKDGWFSPQRIKRSIWTRTLVATLILLWPVVVFGHAGFFSDTTSYYKGGAAAVQFARKVVHEALASRPPSGPAEMRREDAPRAQKSPAGEDVRGARSIPYSIVAYLAAGDSGRFLALATLQSATAALCLISLFTLAGMTSFWLSILSVAALAIATPIAWFTCYAMPDIYAGLTILGLVLLAAPSSSRLHGACLFLVTTFAIASHASHVLLALVLIGVLFAWELWLRRSVAAGLLSLRWSVLAVAGACALVASSGLIGFGEASLAPKRFPLALGAGLDQGPARWYLEANCATRRYEICRLYPHGIPKSSYEFLWGPQGVSKSATPAQLARLREEEQPILIAAARAYPTEASGRVIQATLRQLVTFGLGSVAVNLEPSVAADTIVLVKSGAPPMRLRRTTELLTWLSCSIALVYLVFAARSKTRYARAVWVILIGLVVNAAICAALSAVADRYQARVIWLLPLAALTLAAHRRSLTRSAGQDAPARGVR